MSRFGSVFILGDSYSTFENCIPEGYPTYYTSEECENSDVVSADQTWWRLLLNRTGDSLVMNNSWSGSPICFRGYQGADARNSSFITRMEQLIHDGFFEDHPVDTIFVFGGTNDNWMGAPLGKMMFSDWKDDDLYSVLPAFGRLFGLLAEKLPNVHVVCIVNTELSTQITVGLCEAAEYFGADIVRLSEIDKICGHPTIAGMKKIADQILDTLK